MSGIFGFGVGGIRHDCGRGPRLGAIGMRRIANAAGFLGACLFASACLAQERLVPPPPSATPESGVKADGVDLGKPLPEPELQVLPIDLATALQLSGSRPIDVQLARVGVRGATASLLQAHALWLPTITIGGDYYRHDGDIQDSSGAIVNDSHSALMFGLGSGFGTSALLSPNDAIFSSLAARQTLNARQSDVQAATNDSMLGVTNAYFAVQQARGELAAAQDATRRTEEILRRVKSLATGLVPELEIVRAEAELARRQETEVFARESWQVAGTELARILLLDAAAQLEPLEPPQLRITLVEPDRPIDELITIGLMNRPELAADRALVRAALARFKQEKLRPFIPLILLRGDSTPVGGTLGAGIFAGGSNGDLGSTAARSDWDLQVLWQLDNLGVGNVARARVRDAEHQAAILELTREQQRVAAEVARAYAQARQASRRVVISDRQVRLAVDSYNKNLIGLGQVRRAGELVQTIVRPQEAIAAIQSLAQAYSDYFRAVADSNRAQFRLYRAMGQPAQLLGQRMETKTPDVVPPPPAPPATSMPAQPPGASAEEFHASFHVRDLESAAH
jgi:outer membrane protein TolC